MTTRAKYWTVVDGVVGTAHTSRDGKQVDFRRAVEMRAEAQTKWDAQRCVNVQASVDLVLYPEHDCRLLRLAATAVDDHGWTADADGLTERRPASRYTSTYSGVTLTATLGHVESRSTARGLELQAAATAGYNAGVAWKAADAQHAAAMVRANPMRGLSKRLRGRMARVGDGRRAMAEVDVLAAYAAYYGVVPTLARGELRAMFAST